MEIIAATNNVNKLKEIREIFEGVTILSLKDAGIECDPEENGSTFEENALIKARAIFEIAKKPVLSDDSGLIVYALDGAPGIQSARYAGVHGDNDANNEKLLRELCDKVDRRAEFVSVVAFVSSSHCFTATGSVKGEILMQKVGDKGFGYDPLFYSYDISKSFGVASSQEKNSVSHRGRALNNLRKILTENKVLL